MKRTETQKHELTRKLYAVVKEVTGQHCAFVTLFAPAGDPKGEWATNLQTADEALDLLEQSTTSLKQAMALWQSAPEGHA